MPTKTQLAAQLEESRALVEALRGLLLTIAGVSDLPIPAIGQWEDFRRAAGTRVHAIHASAANVDIITIPTSLDRVSKLLRDQFPGLEYVPHADAKRKPAVLVDGAALFDVDDAAAVIVSDIIEATGVTGPEAAAAAAAEVELAKSSLLEIDADEMRLNVKPFHVAKRIEEGAWKVSWIPGELLTRDEAITALTIAEVVATTDFSVPTAPIWTALDGWAAELGIMAPQAVVRAAASPESAAEMGPLVRLCKQVPAHENSDLMRLAGHAWCAVLAHHGRREG